MAKSRWQEIGAHLSREDAEAQVKSQRASGSKDCKYRIREERRQSMFTRMGEHYGETRYVVSYLCPGVY